MQDNYKGYPDGYNIPMPYTVYGSGRGDRREIQENQTLRDMEYFRSLYPGRMKRLQEYVANACDKMDYKNSPMYDEYPDRVMIEQVCGSICQKIMEDHGGRGSDTGFLTEVLSETSDYSTEVEEVEVYEAGHIQQARPWNPPPPGPPWGPPPPRPPWGPPPPPGPPWGPPPPRPPWGPPQPPGPPWGPPHHPRPPKPPSPNWMDDMIRILFLNEMHNRRCRTGNCR